MKQEEAVHLAIVQDFLKLKTREQISSFNQLLQQVIIINIG